MSDPIILGSLTGLFLLMAVLYSSVGQGGGSGYLAAMALIGVAPENFRLIALSLNVVVASIGLVKFRRAGHFDGRLLLPFALASVPAALVGGALSLPGQVFKPLMGVVLLWAAILVIWKPPVPEGEEKGRPPVPVSLIVGAGIGFLSGMVGIGGGIFLAPFLVLGGWASARTTAAVSSGFILVNSISALVGVFSHTQAVPTFLPIWMGVVALGGWLGAEYGANRFRPITLHRLLALVLFVAGMKIIVAG